MKKSDKITEQQKARLEKLEPRVKSKVTITMFRIRIRQDPKLFGLKDPK